MSDTAFFPWLEAPLTQVLGGVRGHALLLHGARGVGQLDLALAVAGGWLCEADAGARPNGRACGHCAACRLISSRTHPDLMVVLPPALRETLGWAGEDDTASDGSKSKAKPSKDIKVEAVRAAVEFAQQTSARGRGKVVVLNPAERMNATSANTLLKTLEEPPGATRFILASAAPQRLLPTVRSRCQSIGVLLPAADVATEWLAAQGVDRPGVVLAGAGGAPLEALDRLAAGIDAAAWQALPAAVLAGRPAALSGWTVPMVVDSLQKLCHDLVAMAVGAAPRYFAAAGLPASGDVDELIRCSRLLAESARHAEHPWNAPLAIEALVQRVTQAARGASAHGRPHAAPVPLATLIR